MRVSSGGVSRRGCRFSSCLHHRKPALSATFLLPSPSSFSIEIYKSPNGRKCRNVLHSQLTDWKKVEKELRLGMEHWAAGVQQHPRSSYLPHLGGSPRHPFTQAEIQTNNVFLCFLFFFVFIINHRGCVLWVREDETEGWNEMGCAFEFINRITVTYWNIQRLFAHLSINICQSRTK